MATAPRQAPEAAKPPVLLFDGDCGFCTTSVGWVRRVVRPSANVAAWQLTDLAALGVTEQQCRRSIQWVPAAGRVDDAAGAAAALVRTGRGAWPVVGMLLSLPVVAQVADVVYRLIARHRHRLPGSTASCEV